MTRKGHEGIFRNDGKGFLMGVVLYGCIHWSNSLDCTLKICLIICKLYLSKRLYYQKKRSNRDGALLVPFFPTIGNFCPEFSIPVYLNAFSIYAFILKQYMLLFCMFFRLYHIHICVYGCMYSVICYFCSISCTWDWFIYLISVADHAFLKLSVLMYWNTT